MIFLKSAIFLNWLRVARQTAFHRAACQSRPGHTDPVSRLGQSGRPGPGTASPAEPSRASVSPVPYAGPGPGVPLARAGSVQAAPSRAAGALGGKGQLTSRWKGQLSRAGPGHWQLTWEGPAHLGRASSLGKGQLTCRCVLSLFCPRAGCQSPVVKSRAFVRRSACQDQYTDHVVRRFGSAKQTQLLRTRRIAKYYYRFVTTTPGGHVSGWTCKRGRDHSDTQARIRTIAISHIPAARRTHFVPKNKHKQKKNQQIVCWV